MHRFKVGDRVQLTGDIARFYKCVTGVVTDSSPDHSSVLLQYMVRLADGAVSTFFDFQLQSPPLIRGRVVFDSSASKKGANPDAVPERRQIQMAGVDIEVVLEISGVAAKSISGRVSVGKAAISSALVTVLTGSAPIATKSTDDHGEVEFSGLPSGEVILETVVPGKRMTVALNLF